MLVTSLGAETELHARSPTANRKQQTLSEPIHFSPTALNIIARQVSHTIPKKKNPVQKYTVVVFVVAPSRLLQEDFRHCHSRSHTLLSQPRQGCQPAHVLSVDLAAPLACPTRLTLTVPASEVLTDRHHSHRRT